MRKVQFKSHWLAYMAGILLSCSAGGQNLLQNDQKPAQKNDTAEVVRPIELGNINTFSSSSVTLYSRIGNNRLKAAEREAISRQTDSLSRETSEYIADTTGKDLEQLNFRELELMSNTLIYLTEQISDVQKLINRRLTDLQERKQELVRNRRRWQLTSDETGAEDTPEAIQKRIRDIISKNDSVTRIIQQDIDFLLTQSDRLTSQQIRLDQFSLDMEQLDKLRSSKFFQRDMPPIWLSRHPADTLDKGSSWTNFRSNFREDTRLMKAEYDDRLVAVFIIFILFLAVLFWLRTATKQSEIHEKKLTLSLFLNEIFRKPVEVALLLVLYLAGLIMPDIPTSYNALMAIIATYAILRIALEILPSDLRKFLIGIAIAYILLRLYNLFYDQFLPGRLLLLTAQVIASIYLLIFLMRKHPAAMTQKSFFSFFLSGLSAVFLVFLLISVFGNILGAISMAEFISSGIIRSAFLILTTYVGFHVLVSVFYLLMSSNLIQQLNVIKMQFRFIFSRVYGFSKVFFVISWVIISLEYFNVRQDFVAWGSEFLNRPLNIGKASFTPMSILLFLFVIWLSFFISRVIRHVLMEDVFTRVKIKRGVPGTIIMLLRITLVSIGFLLAAAAAGIKLDSLAIILGAFSVGIGFGLQNIFNNLVSGLILAFERPIKAGDIVEVNALLGTVKQIGIRSSVVKTFEGAEVIVPNGELISNELINWTLSDQFRRADIRVGVTYGTDPKKVTDLLLKVARENPLVLNEPSPKPYFIDFGDSSLNFRLLAWIDQDHRLEVESELRIQINDALREAGIEIPFPQRDLHVRSVDRDILDKLDKS